MKSNRPDRTGQRLPARVRALGQGWRDRLAAADPGGNQLAGALAVGASVSVAVALEYGLAQLAHPLWITSPGLALPPVQAAQLAIQHHGVTELAMLLGGIVALLSASVNGPTPRNRAITILGLPIPLLATLTLGIELTGHRALGLVVFTLVVAAG
ncbi:MAG TPA: hypothetical protein VGH56_01405, partial [Solirubrobacteraceae bacterium]